MHCCYERNKIHKNLTVFREKHNKTLEMGAPASSRRSADPHRERSILLLLPPSRGSRHGVAETKCALIGGTIREAYWSDVSTFSFLFLFYSFRWMEGEEGEQRVAWNVTLPWRRFSRVTWSHRVASRGGVRGEWEELWCAWVTPARCKEENTWRGEIAMRKMKKGEYEIVKKKRRLPFQNSTRFWIFLTAIKCNVLRSSRRVRIYFDCYISLLVNNYTLMCHYFYIKQTRISRI